MAAQRIHDLVLALRQLEVEVRADPGRLVHEEAQRLVEGRRVRPDVLARVRDDERAGVLRITSNSTTSTPASTAARNDASVFSGASARGPAVADTERTAVSPIERDHGLGLVGR